MALQFGRPCAARTTTKTCVRKRGGELLDVLYLFPLQHTWSTFINSDCARVLCGQPKTHFLCGWANSSNKEVDTTSQTHCQRGWANSSSKKVDTALAADAYVASRLYTVRTLYTRGCTYCTVLYVCAKPPILIVRDCASDKWGWCKRWRNWGYCACCTTRPSTYVLHCVQRA